MSIYVIYKNLDNDLKEKIGNQELKLILVLENDNGEGLYDFDECEKEIKNLENLIKTTTIKKEYNLRINELMEGTYELTGNVNKLTKNMLNDLTKMFKINNTNYKIEETIMSF